MEHPYPQYSAWGTYGDDALSVPTEAPQGDFDIIPCVITPEDAHARRVNLLAKEKERLTERRAASRTTRTAMERAGRRPKRERTRRGTVSFVSANVNCADRLIQEL